MWFRVPYTIHTDQRRNFESTLFSETCRLLRITKTRTTYRSSANGQVERYNRILLAMIRCYLDGQQKDWDEHIPLFGMAIRFTTNRNTGFIPNFLMLGREISLPDQLFGFKKLSRDIPSYLKNVYQD